MSEPFIMAIQTALQPSQQLPHPCLHSAHRRLALIYHRWMCDRACEFERLCTPLRSFSSHRSLSVVYFRGVRERGFSLCAAGDGAPRRRDLAEPRTVAGMAMSCSVSCSVSCSAVASSGLQREFRALALCARRFWEDRAGRDTLFSSSLLSTAATMMKRCLFSSTLGSAPA